MAFRRAIFPLNTEHNLGLVDPDELEISQDSADKTFYILCRDAKDLWQEDRQRWLQVVQNFQYQAKYLRSNWVHKPRADPSTLSYGSKVENQQMLGCFRRLMEEEKSRYVPQSTLPFPDSQQEAILLAMADEDADDLPTLPSRSMAVHPEHAPDSSGTMQASSSTIDALMQCEADANALRILQSYDEIDMRDAMAVDQYDLVSTTRGVSEIQNLDHQTLERESMSTMRNSASRKRPASECPPDNERRRRKSEETYPQLKGCNGAKMNYSFDDIRDSFPSGNFSRTLSRSSSANASFKSVRTEVNDSFATYITSPSFGPQYNHDSTSPPGALQRREAKARDYKEHLLRNSPFRHSSLIDCFSYRVAFEILRVASHNDYDDSEILQHIQAQKDLLYESKSGLDVQDLDKLWLSFKQYVLRCGGTMPTKVSEKAWKTCDEERRGSVPHTKLNFSGTVRFEESTSGPLLKLKLNPLAMEQSNRLKRKFGSDRFLVLAFPSLETADLPSHLKGNSTELRQAVIDWLTTTSHSIVGRQWRAFYVKSKPRAKNEDKKTLAWRVYLFATDGPGFSRYSVDNKEAHQAVDIERMLEWCFSLRANETQPLLKLFSRLQLLVSDTVATLMFKLGSLKTDQTELAHFEMGRVIERDDIYCNGSLMNDGCGRISLRAAELIFRTLGLVAPFPSAFQGRIAGAKGMWIVEPSNEGKQTDLWIEITPSQTKFDSLSRDISWPDINRITFEVHEFSRPLRPAALNFQLLPILIDRGVKAEVFMELLKADLDRKVADLESAIATPQSLRAWNHEQFAVSESRSLSDGISWDGGMPQHDAEHINALTEAGFTPESCSYLRELCRAAITSYCTKVEERMNIYPGKTVYAYMVPDFKGVLEEDEIHLGFSSAFIDKRSNWSDTMLNDVDVLVARSPASLPSDIRKVRAVFKPELAHLKDVIVFPITGRFCLACWLSGGDYDGDIAWICWNETIVKDFKNFDAIKQKPYQSYGIQKDQTNVSDILGSKRDDPLHAAEATQFIKAGFEFNMRKSLLGKCTNVHEAYCYKIVRDAIQKGFTGSFFSPMSDAKAMDLGNLLGYLVDTAKNGFILTEDDCNKYLESIGARYLPDPAYKKRNGAVPTQHIIDRLVLEVAVEFRQNALKTVDRMFERSPSLTTLSKDHDLTKIFRDEEALARSDNIVSFVLQTLKEDVRKVHSSWERLIANQKMGSLSWGEVHALVREAFLNILPAQEPNALDHPTVQRWLYDVNDKSLMLSTRNSWSLLRASALYTQFSSGSFPWRACGKELLALKVLANRDGVSISKDMHQYFKFDRRMWDSAKLKRSERDESGLADDVNRFDEDDFMSQAPEDAYESQANAE